MIILRYGSSDMAGKPVRSFPAVGKILGLDPMTIMSAIKRFVDRGCNVDVRTYFNGFNSHSTKSESTADTKLRKLT